MFCLVSVPNIPGRPQSLRHGAGAGPQAGSQVNTVYKLVPHAGLPAQYQPLLFLTAVEVQWFGQVVLCINLLINLVIIIFSTQSNSRNF